MGRHPYLTGAETGLRDVTGTSPEQGGGASSQAKWQLHTKQGCPCTLNSTNQSVLPLTAGPMWQVTGALGQASGCRLRSGNDGDSDGIHH